MKKILLTLMIMYSYSMADLACSILPFQENPNMEPCLKVIESYENDKTLTNEKRRKLIRDNSFPAASGFEKLGKYTQAAEMWEKSIANGDCEAGDGCNAKNMLAILYASGKGVQMNHIKAYELFRDALKNGNVDAQGNLDILCSKSPWACK